MAIEVIRQGTHYAERLFEVECRACHSLLRFTGNDVEEGVSVLSIVCPVCKAANKVPEPVTGPIRDVTPGYSSPPHIKPLMGGAV